MDGKDALPPERIEEALAGLPGWRSGDGGLVTVFKLPTAAAALELFAAVGRLAEEQNHHPDLDCGTIASLSVTRPTTPGGR